MQNGILWVQTYNDLIMPFADPFKFYRYCVNYQKLTHPLIPTTVLSCLVIYSEQNILPLNHLINVTSHMKLKQYSGNKHIFKVLTSVITEVTSIVLTWCAENFILGTLLGLWYVKYPLWDTILYYYCSMYDLEENCRVTIFGMILTLTFLLLILNLFKPSSNWYILSILSHLGSIITRKYRVEVWTETGSRSCVSQRNVQS